MTREEAITVFKAFMDNPLFSDVHKQAFNIAIHDIKQRHDWDINKLMLVPKTEWEQEPTTKNDLGVDCISKQAVLNKILKFSVTDGRSVSVTSLWTEVNELPLVPPQEPQSFKWCDTCKEYDQEKHCCHRYSKVIRDTVAEIEQDPRWIPVSERLPASNQLNSISISKNDLGVDLIPREKVMQILQEHWLSGTVAHRIIAEIGNDIQRLPSITPQEPRWISVSEKLPNDRDWYLGIFKEPDTGWINPIPFICDYVGRETKATTKEFWILRGFTDMDEHIDYYFNLECVAWMPLPTPYEPQESEK